MTVVDGKVNFVWSWLACSFNLNIYDLEEIEEKNKNGNDECLLTRDLLSLYGSKIFSNYSPFLENFNDGRKLNIFFSCF